MWLLWDGFCPSSHSAFIYELRLSEWNHIHGLTFVEGDDPAPTSDKVPWSARFYSHLEVIPPEIVDFKEVMRPRDIQAYADSMSDQLWPEER